MAEGGREDYSACRGLGRVRALLQAIEDFRVREERDQGPPSPPPRIQGGRAGAPGVNRGHMDRRLGGVTACNP